MAIFDYDEDLERRRRERNPDRYPDMFSSGYEGTMGMLGNPFGWGVPEVPELRSGEIPASEGYSTPVTTAQGGALATDRAAYIQAQQDRTMHDIEQGKVTFYPEGEFAFPSNLVEYGPDGKVDTLMGGKAIETDLISFDYGMLNKKYKDKYKTAMDKGESFTIRQTELTQALNPEALKKISSIGQVPEEYRNNPILNPLYNTGTVIPPVVESHNIADSLKYNAIGGGSINPTPEVQDILQGLRDKPLNDAKLAEKAKENALAQSAFRENLGLALNVYGLLNMDNQTSPYFAAGAPRGQAGTRVEEIPLYSLYDPRRRGMLG